MKYITRSSEETASFGFLLGKHLLPGDTVLLYGDLGSGKSVLARGCAKALGVDGSMASPTFTLMQPYRGNDFPVYHFDLYRLLGPLDEHIGGDGVALIEWPQQADGCPGKRIEIDFEQGIDPETRQIEMNLIGMDGREEEIFASVLEFQTETI